ncbi:MAG: hypothetical protein KBF69_07850 [Saprospiraceae bacterium]|nr:hypothetical protein [Saprospiraceae bacterium]
MHIINKYNINFFYKDNSPIVEIESKVNILSQYLMYWNNYKDIIDILIPEINFGIKYGTDDRFCKYCDVVGLETKMKERWVKSNQEGLRDKIDIEKLWDEIKNYTGYYIKELDFWLEGIGGDVTGIAFVTAKNTTIDGSDLGDLPITLPSQDFKEIVIEWLAFILRNREILPKIENNNV